LILCIIYGCILLGSKGGLLTLLFLGILGLKYIRWQSKILFVSIGIIAIVISFSHIINYMINVGYNLEKYSSLTTRLTMILAAIISLFHNPIGSGFGSYLIFFDSNIIEAKKVVEMILNYFGIIPIFYEVNTYLYSAKNYATKSMLFNLIMFFGWFGLIIFVYLHYKIYKKIGRNTALRLLFLFLLIEHIFFVDSLYLYNFWFAFAFIYNYWRLDVEKNINYSK